MKGGMKGGGGKGMRGGEWKWGCREGSGREWRGLGKGSERRDEGREMEGGNKGGE